MKKECVSYSINAGGYLLDLSTPCVMGILNCTPDSFYTSISPDSPTFVEATTQMVSTMLAAGAAIIDVGGCSTRPGGEPADAATEQQRLDATLKVIRANFPETICSVDTFRPEIGEWSIKEHGVQIINDVSGGSSEMFDMVAQQGVPYILTFNEARRQDIDVTRQALQFFAEKVQQLRDRGTKDIILDPGFGFNKSLDENYELLSHLEDLQILELPILVGISHKSMIYRLLGITPADSLNGTTVLNTLSLIQGANILRVHEVEEAQQCIRLVQKL